MVNHSWLLEKTYWDNKWYQSRRANMFKRGYDQLTEGGFKYERDFWNKRRMEVMQRMNHLKVSDQSSEFIPKQKTLNNMKKMKRARCYICFIRGHAYWNCPNKNKRAVFDRKKGKDIRLSVEKKDVEGCDSKTETTENKRYETLVPSINWEVNGTGDGSWNCIWYVCDEYARHMTPNKGVFYKFKHGDEGTSASGEKGLNIQGVGEILLQTETKVFVIPGVLYVPNTGLNTLSLNQLIQQGFSVEFKDTKCDVKRLFDDETDEDSGNDEGDNGMDVDNEEVDGQILKQIKKRAVSVLIEHNEVGEEKPTKNDVDSLINFMGLLFDCEIIDNCKGLVKKHLEKLITWFHKCFLNEEEKEFPIKIGNKEIDILELFLIIKNHGGYECVFKEDKWELIAVGMGLSIESAEDVKFCYTKYLGILVVYADLARKHSREDLAHLVGNYKSAALDYACFAGAEMSATATLPDEEELPGGVLTKQKDASVEEAQNSKENDVKAGYEGDSSGDDFVIIK